jgi:hypothetical protein
MTRISALKPLAIAALVVVLGAGTFLYANHATVASHFGGNPLPAENALHQVPAVTGIDSSAALYW